MQPRRRDGVKKSWCLCENIICRLECVSGCVFTHVHVHSAYCSGLITHMNLHQLLQLLPREMRAHRRVQQRATSPGRPGQAALGIQVWPPHTAVKLDVLRRPCGAGTALSRLISSSRRHSAPWAKQPPLFSQHCRAKGVYYRTGFPMYYRSVTDPELSRAIQSVTISIFKHNTYRHMRVLLTKGEILKKETTGWVPRCCANFKGRQLN